MHRAISNSWYRTPVSQPLVSAVPSSVGPCIIRSRWVWFDRSHPVDPVLPGAIPAFRRFFRRPISTDSTESQGPATVEVQDPPTATSSTPSSSPNDKNEENSDVFGLQDLWKEVRDPTAMGKRGEGWFLAQVLAFLLILLPPIKLKGLLGAAGAIAVGTGAVFIAYAVLSLGRNISPFPYPRKTAKLVTHGMYEYARHPMYSGLLLTCLGISAVGHSEVRMVVSLLLWWVLEKKVEFEEAKLIERFPEYEEYRSNVKKFFPLVY